MSRIGLTASLGWWCSWPCVTTPSRTLKPCLVEEGVAAHDLAVFVEHEVGRWLTPSLTVSSEISAMAGSLGFHQTLWTTCWLSATACTVELFEQQAVHAVSQPYFTSTGSYEMRTLLSNSARLDGVRGVPLVVVVDLHHLGRVVGVGLALARSLARAARPLHSSTSACAGRRSNPGARGTRSPFGSWRSAAVECEHAVTGRTTVLSVYHATASKKRSPVWAPPSLGSGPPRLPA